MRKPSLILPALAAIGALAGAAGHAADFAPVGAKATLSVSYRFESSGKLGPSTDKVRELHEWQALRQVELKADLVAAKPLPTPVMQAVDAAQAARMQQQGSQVQRAAAQMAPMMAGAEAILAKCGNDEKCLEREAMKMGAAMSGTQQLDDTLKAGREGAAAVQPSAARYQAWRVAAHGGTYHIEQSSRVVHRDPVCMVNPGSRCTRRHVGKGDGPLPQPPKLVAIHAAEVDTQAQTLTLQLPAPLMPLPYSETVTSDEPKGGQVVPPGTHARQLLFRVTGDGKATPDKPFTVALKGGWRTQGGEMVVPVKGDASEGGTLHVRWKFAAQ
jgi:hypothetical protein